MSILSDRDIRRALDRGDIRIGYAGAREWEDAPEEPWRIQPSSLEVTLGVGHGSLLGYTRPMTGSPVGIVDPEDPPAMVPRVWERTARKDERGWRPFYILRPGEFVLGSTAEQLFISPALCAAIEGKSSLGRLGLMIHATARFIDPGWVGRLTLEFFNASPRPIRLWGGMRIGQVRFERLSSPSERPYGDESLGSHYQGSVDTVQASSVAYVAPEPVLLTTDTDTQIRHARCETPSLVAAGGDLVCRSCGTSLALPPPA